MTWNLTLFDVFSKVNINYGIYVLLLHVLEQLDSVKKFQHYVLFYQEPEPAQYRPAPKP